MIIKKTETEVRNVVIDFTRRLFVYGDNSPVSIQAGCIPSVSIKNVITTSDDKMAALPDIADQKIMTSGKHVSLTISGGLNRTECKLHVVVGTECGQVLERILDVVVMGDYDDDD